MTDLATARQLAERLIPPESAEETLARVKAYLEHPHLPSRTSIPLALAAIYVWEERHQQ